MKPYYLLLIFLIVAETALTQKLGEFIKPKTIPGEDGDKTTITTYELEKGKYISVIERRNKWGDVSRTRWERDKDGNYIRTCGKKDRDITILDSDFKLIRREITIETIDYPYTTTITYTRQPDGSFKASSNGYGYSDYGPQQVEGIEGEIKEEIKLIEDDSVSSDPPKSISCLPEKQGCQSIAELYIGYSFLKGDYGIKKESFPVGAQVSFMYNLSSRVAAGIDLGTNRRKIGEETLSRTAYMGRGRYIFKKCPGVGVSIDIMAGLAVEKFGDSKGNGFAYAVAVPIAYPLTKKLDIQAEAGYLGMKFKNTKDAISNFRFTLGVKMKIGKVKTVNPKFNGKVSDIK